LEHRSHVFSDLLLFQLHLVDNEVVLFLFIVVLLFNISHLLAEGPQLFDSGCQLCLFFFHFLLDLLDKKRQLLHGLALVVVQLLL